MLGWMTYSRASKTPVAFVPDPQCGRAFIGVSTWSVQIDVTSFWMDGGQAWRGCQVCQVSYIFNPMEAKIGVSVESTSEDVDRAIVNDDGLCDRTTWATIRQGSNYG